MCKIVGQLKREANAVARRINFFQTLVAGAGVNRKRPRTPRYT
jgi:hypothetical protein